MEIYCHNPKPKEKSPPNRCGSCLGEIRRGVKHKCSQASKKKNILEMIRTDSIDMQKQIVGSAVKSLAMSNSRHATKRSEGHNETVMLGRVTGSHNFTVSVGKEEKKGGFLTASTFRKIEVSMDMSRNSILKLKKILKEEVSVDKGIREALKSWDNLGAN